VKVNCLAQEDNTMSGQDLKPDSWGLESGEPTMKPLQLLNRKSSGKCAHGRSMKIRRVNSYEKVTLEFQQGCGVGFKNISCSGGMDIFRSNSTLIQFTTQVFCSYSSDQKLHIYQET